MKTTITTQDACAADNPATACIAYIRAALSRNAYMLDSSNILATVTLANNPPEPIRRMTPEDKTEAARMFTAGTHTPQEIADALGFSCAAITGYLARAGLRARLTTSRTN
jgi:hypothetical protein